MPVRADADLPAPLYLFRPKGATRITYHDAHRISEAFDKTTAPTRGAICVLVQNADSFDDPPEEDFTNGDFIIALAVIGGIAGVASGTVRATLAPILRLLAPVPIGTPQDAAQLGEVPPDYQSRNLGPETSIALIAHLKGVDPTVAPWLEKVFGEPRTFPPQVEQSRVEAKDAVQLAAQLAGVELPSDAFVSPPASTENETLLQTLLNAGYEHDSEEELLPLDMQRFDGKLVGQQRAASVAIFSDKKDEEKLLVMSVNKKPIELVLGVDLLYWDQIHDAFTFIQYKRLERKTSADEWAYTRKSEIEKQLKMMPTGRDTPAEAADWRAFETPFWFKFVRGDAGSKLDNKTLKGMHIPADWLRLAMSEEKFKSGPKGGFRVTYDNAKYLGRSAFTQLISRGFVGTAGGRSEEFKEVLHAGDKELIIAVRAKWQKDEEPLGSSSASGDADGALVHTAPPGAPF